MEDCGASSPVPSSELRTRDGLPDTVSIRTLCRVPLTSHNPRLDANHFVQEDAGEEIAQRAVEWAGRA